MKWIIWDVGSGWQATTEENYRAYISNARLYKKFERSMGFESEQDVKDYLCGYFGATEVIRREDYKL